MFGIIKPCQKNKSTPDFLEYKKYYCALCVGMDRNFGLLTRTFVNYDLTSVYMLFDSIKIHNGEKTKRCPLNPFKQVKYIDNPILLDRISVVNFLMVYFKFVDDVHDDKSLFAWILVKALNPSFKRIRSEQTVLTSNIEENLNEISHMEYENKLISLKDASSLFGKIMSNSLSNCLSDDLESEICEEFAYWLGIWIYLLDACLDYSKDFKTSKYNPIFAGLNQSESEIMDERSLEIKDLIVECLQAFDQLITLMDLKKNETFLRDLFMKSIPRDVTNLLQMEA